jgi:hypothetical protein
LEGALDVLDVLLFSTLVVLGADFVGRVFSEVLALLPLFDSGSVTEYIEIALYQQRLRFTSIRVLESHREGRDGVVRIGSGWTYPRGFLRDLEGGIGGVNSC